MFPELDCANSGWNVLIYATQAAVGDWRAAWKGVSTLPKTAFLDAGGNGHSLSNSLWYIATRPTAGSNFTDISDPAARPVSSTVSSPLRKLRN